MDDFIFLSEDIKLHKEFLESMEACLYCAEKHAVVFGQLIEDKMSFIETAKRYLQEYSLIPQVNADNVNIDCVMIKQSVIETFGEPLQPGVNLRDALADYCNKINKFGFSTIIAHHALYSRSEDFADKRGELRVRSDGSGKDGLCNPLLHFLTLLDDDYYPRKRILFDCIIMPPSHGGTTEIMLSAYEAFYRLFKDKYDIFLYTNREAAEFHSISDKYENILYPDTIEDDIFHLGYAPNQLRHYESQLHMNKHCLKIVQNMLDMQMVRINGHFDDNVRDNVDMGVDICDGIVFISNFGINDFKAYYQNRCSIEENRLKIIYIAKKMPPGLNNDDYELPFDEFFLIPGSSYKHKAVIEAIEAVKGTKYSFIAIGTEDTGYIYPNVYGYMGGRLEDNFINHLYANCKAVIFPSLYEGFGIPTIMALINGKRVIVHDNEVNRELFEHYSESKEQFLFFRRFEQISDFVENMDFSVEIDTPIYNDSWDRVAEEMESFFDEILSDEIASDRLLRRWRIYKQIEAMNQVISQFDDYKLSSLLRFAVKENIKQRHQKLFRWLKGKRRR